MKMKPGEASKGQICFSISSVHFSSSVDCCPQGIAAAKGCFIVNKVKKWINEKECLGEKKMRQLVNNPGDFLIIPRLAGMPLL